MEQVAGVSRKIAFEISSPLGISENSLMDISLQFSYLLEGFKNMQEIEIPRWPFEFPAK